MRALLWLSLLMTALVGPALGCGRGASEPRPTLVFAAASLRPVVTDAVAASGQAGAPIRVSYASTSTLARQIEAGAPADLLLSANEAWIRWLSARGRLEDDAIVPLGGNRLVLIAPRERPFTWRPGEALASAFDGPLALAEPSHVPAGVYAKQALERLGAWAALAPRVVGASDVRAALRFVAQGGASAAIVYRTDALSSDAVTVVAELDADLHDPIRYLGAPIRGHAGGAAERLLKLLSGPEGRAIFARHGFTPTPGATRVEEQTERPGAGSAP